MEAFVFVATGFVRVRVRVRVRIRVRVMVRVRVRVRVRAWRFIRGESSDNSRIEAASAPLGEWE